MKLFYFLFIVLTLKTSFTRQSGEKKNVVIIMADDLGFNDVSFHGSTEIPTYNIDALAYNGIILNNFKTPPMCTPSRSAFMTGKYPHHLGMQNLVIFSDEPWGLPLSEKLMPQYFKESGYVTRLVGKWHLGFFQEQYLPNNRGFDSFFGYYGAWIDYWDYTLHMFDRNFSRGYDLRENGNVAKIIKKKYATELFTDEAVKVIRNHDKTNPLFLVVNHLAPHTGNEDFPMQAKKEDIDRFRYIADKKRKVLAAMVYQLDKSVGEIVTALKENDLLDDSIIIFYSDNGGPSDGFHSNKASNYPLRGQKLSAWEGGTRTAAFVYSKSLPQNVVRNNMFFVGDWLPTLSTLTEANFEINANIDGIDQTDMLRYNKKIRNELVTIDDVLGYSSYISNDYKILNGTVEPFNGAYDEWLGSNDNINAVDLDTYIKNVHESAVSRAIKSTLTSKKIKKLRESAVISCKNKCFDDQCDLFKGPCLFDISNDPCEERNLINSRKALFNRLMKNFDESLINLVPSGRQPSDPKSDPKYFDNTWSSWQPNSII